MPRIPKPQGSGRVLITLGDSRAREVSYHIPPYFNLKGVPPIFDLTHLQTHKKINHPIPSFP